MTIAADKTGAQQGTGGAQSSSSKPEVNPAPEAPGAARPVLAHDKRRGLGRGLEWLFPGPPPAGGGLGSAGSGLSSPGSGLASAGGGAAAAAVSGDVGASSGAPVPGVIAEL